MNEGANIDTTREADLDESPSASWELVSLPLMGRSSDWREVEAFVEELERERSALDSDDSAGARRSGVTSRLAKWFRRSRSADA